MKIIIAIPLSIFLFTPIKIKGQTLNNGEVKVMPGTLIAVESAFTNGIDATLINDGDIYVFDSLHNDGFITFSEGRNGVFYFEGKKKQFISGNSPPDFFKFNDIVFNNESVQPAFDLTGNISVSGVSYLTQGIIKINNVEGVVVYEANATHNNTSNESHIDGYVEKRGKNEFTYPVGNSGYYRPAIIIPTDSDEKSTEYLAKYFLENSNLLHPHRNRAENLVLINDKEYWTIFNSSVLNHPATDHLIVKLTWDEAATPEFIWKDLDNSNVGSEMITIARWDKDKAMWVDEGGIVEVGSNGPGTGTVTSFSHVSGEGIFTLARIKNRKEPAGNVTVYNAVSANNDGKNDYFLIDGINNYPNNHVEIYNRWGVKVFETQNYDSKGNVFKGFSEGRTTISSNEMLPEGTYFYILKYEMKNDTGFKSIEKTGYLYLKSN